MGGICAFGGKWETSVLMGGEGRARATLCCGRLRCGAAQMGVSRPSMLKYMPGPPNAPNDSARYRHWRHSPVQAPSHHKANALRGFEPVRVAPRRQRWLLYCTNCNVRFSICMSVGLWR